MNTKLLGLVLCFSVVLSACGFSPLYATRNAATGTSVVTELAAISVQAPGDQLNRALRQALEDRLRADGSLPARYTLQLRSTLAERDVAIQQDTEVTRKNLVVTSDFALIDMESGDTLYDASVVAIAAYNRVASEFANIIAERDARDRAATQAAEEIRASVAVFFQRQHGA
ncbi:MAG: LPS assembly lipoprotein LptE [Parvibaculaceae bacterium]|jgi:LPS-assembly lipoprotein